MDNSPENKEQQVSEDTSVSPEDSQDGVVASQEPQTDKDNDLQTDQLQNSVDADRALTETESKDADPNKSSTHPITNVPDRKPPGDDPVTENETAAKETEIPDVDSTGVPKSDATVVPALTSEAPKAERDSSRATDKLDQEMSPPKSPGKPSEGSPMFIYVLSALATVGGFLFGYDIGIVAGSMLFIQPYFELSTFWQEAVVSGTIGAAAVAALMSGWLTDRIGRKLTIMTSSIVFTAGGVLMGSAPTREVLLLGRVVAGLGVGLASVVVPIYVAEASPTHIRGRLVSLHQMMINTGIVVSSLLAGAFSYVKPDGWRYMLGMAALPGLVQFAGFLFMPESPRWLVGRGLTEKAELVLKRMRGGNDVSEELQEIISTIEEERKESVSGIQHILKILKTQQVRRALFVGSALLFFQQWCGINTVIYYSGTVLKMAGFPVKSAIWLVTVPNAINFLASFIGLYLVEKVGRRPLLIGSLAGTILGLVILAVGFQLSSDNPAILNSTLVEHYSNGSLIVSCTQEYSSCDACVKSSDCGYCFTDVTSGSCLPAYDESRSSAGRCLTSDSTSTEMKWAFEFCPSDYTWIALIGMGVFVFAFAPGLGPMPWTINSEIYPLWARSTCNSLAACCAWVCNLVISFTFLTMTENITIYGTFWMFAAITAVGVAFMVFMLPETKNKTLEEMEQLFMTSGGRQQTHGQKEGTSNVKVSNSDHS
ncbi:proton myo-inositol cotransporter [Aplysia californica]|uniref:Proton myo-inositol cotransporter n=1 Tax=Aplysia californica TaxID=6500 RepID=A0ABM0JYJ6_APLCA|nr:proton myo-inositol cotransporter [Aplysia californica]XP_005104555.1 proton myo-inositol cotransporter [Aplysia californica]XP_005104556.1 proton myo-inositol cotransporter [Aplysia californica]